MPTGSVLLAAYDCRPLHADTSILHRFRVPQLGIGYLHPHDAYSTTLEIEDYHGSEIGLDCFVSYGWIVSNSAEFLGIRLQD